MGIDESADYYGVDSLLSEEERNFRDHIRKFVDEECLPIIADHFDRGTFPMHLIPRMADLGLFGLHVDGYGCRKASHTVYGLVCQELGRCDSGLRAMFSVQNSLVMYPIHAYGSEAQRTKWLRTMARGEAIGCFGLSEPEFGSDPSRMATRAKKERGGFVLNGSKMWITNGPIAQVAIVWARTEDGIRGFLVEGGTPGFQVTSIQRKFSYRTSPTGLLHFKDCFVPAESLLPQAVGLKPVFQCLNFARFGVACGALGAAIACYQEAKAFSMKRKVFEKPIASYQLVQEHLVRMIVEISKAQLLSHQLARLLDQNLAKPAQISLAKLNHVREAMKIARMARDLLGGRGILADHHVIRHLCDLEAVHTLEGTENMHTLIIGQDLTGISAFA
jgi:glutaryl-CoA dehydrogenase